MSKRDQVSHRFLREAKLAAADIGYDAAVE